MKTMRILASAAVAFATAGGALVAGPMFSGSLAHAAEGAAPTANAVDQLWQASLTDPAGKPQSLARFKGHTVVVNFWASWCGPCVKEMPSLSQLQRQYQKKGIQFIGVGVDSNKNVQTFLQKVPVAYPIYVAGFGGADLARNFGNTAGALPFTVVIDASGKVRSTRLGPVQPNELRHTLDTL